MIQVKRLDGQEMILNAELIFSIQKTPDTLISFTTGERLMVKESLEDILSKVIDSRRHINAPLPHVVEEVLYEDQLPSPEDAAASPKEEL